MRLHSKKEMKFKFKLDQKVQDSRHLPDDLKLLLYTSDSIKIRCNSKVVSAECISSEAMRKSWELKFCNFLCLTKKNQEREVRNK